MPIVCKSVLCICVAGRGRAWRAQEGREELGKKGWAGQCRAGQGARGERGGERGGRAGRDTDLCSSKNTANDEIDGQQGAEVARSDGSEQTVEHCKRA